MSIGKIKFQRNKKTPVIKMKTNIALLLTLSLLCLFSCKNNYVLSPEKMEDVLVDVHLVEGLTIEESLKIKKNEDKVDLFNTVYAKHNITAEQFDSSMIYYSHDLHSLEEIYNGVMSRIEKIEKDVKAGNYSLTTAFMGKKTYQRLVHEDMDIFPYVQKEFWNGLRDIEFTKADYKKGKVIEVTVDSLPTKNIEMRYSFNSRSLDSAVCVVTMHYSNDQTSEKTFQLPLDTLQLMKLNWEEEKCPQKISVKFDAVSTEKDALFVVRDIRMYNLTTEKRNLSIF